MRNGVGQATADSYSSYCGDSPPPGVGGEHVVSGDQENGLAIRGLLMEPYGGFGAGAIPQSTVDGSRGAEEAQQRFLHQSGA